MFDVSHPARGYALEWPRSLFEDALAEVVNKLPDRKQRPALDLLFHEALRGPHPCEDLAEVRDGPAAKPWDPWAPEPHPSDEEPAENYCRQFGRQVLAASPDLPVTRRRYYLERLQAIKTESPSKPTNWIDAERDWTALVEDLVERGYLDRRAGDVCEDHKDNEQPQRICEQIEKY